MVPCASYPKRIRRSRLKLNADNPRLRDKYMELTAKKRKLFLFEFYLMYCDLCSQYIQVRKLFKGGNYMRKYGIQSKVTMHTIKPQKGHTREASIK